MDAKMIAALDAIETHGARAVYGAAIAQMEGRTPDLRSLGLEPETLGDVDRIMSLAFRRLSGAEKLIDRVQAQHRLDNL